LHARKHQPARAISLSPEAAGRIGDADEVDRAVRGTNPITADATLNDPTIRRCRGSAKSLDCNGFAVANLYALRSADPAALWSHPDPRPGQQDY
jgi:hypothetical protein